MAHYSSLRGWFSCDYQDVASIKTAISDFSHRASEYGIRDDVLKL